MIELRWVKRFYAINEKSAIGETIMVLQWRYYSENNGLASPWQDVPVVYEEESE